MRVICIVVIACVALLPGVASAQEQKNKVWSCPQCKKNGQSDWKFCPFDGIQLSDGSHLMTLEQAEAFATSKGVVLTGKEESRKDIADRSASYKAQSTVSFAILQFSSPGAAKVWKDLADGIPLVPTVAITNGAIAFVIYDGPDEARADVYTKLGGPGSFPKKGRGLLALADGLGEAKKKQEDNKANSEKETITPLKEESAAPHGTKPVKDGLRVELVSFRVGKLQMMRRPMFGNKGRETESTEELGIVRIKFTNITDTKKIDYITPNTGFNMGDQPHLEDEFGNKYRLKTFDGSDYEKVEGVLIQFGRAMNPEDSREEILAFEVPVKKAAQFVIQLTADNWKGKGVLRISFPRDFK